MSAELVEKVLATVGLTPILESDLALAEIVELIGKADGETAAEYRSRLLARRIHLELQFRDLESTGALHRMELNLAPALDRLCRSTGSREELIARVAEYGLTWADIEDLAIRMTAVEQWIEQRLRPRITVSLEELKQVYEDEIWQPLSKAGQTAPEFQSVRSQLHQLVVERKLNAEIELWLASASARQQITRFHR